MAACYHTRQNADAMEAGVLRMSQAVTGADERRLCARFARPSWGRGLWQLGSTLASFALLWALMAWTVQSGWGRGWALLLALPAAGLFRIIGCVRRSNRARCCSVHRV